LLGLFFDPEDGGNMFLRSVCWLSMDYTALYPRWYSSTLYGGCCRTLNVLLLMVF
jgi:hypothetical protein